MPLDMLGDQKNIVTVGLKFAFSATFLPTEIVVTLTGA